LGCTRLCTRVNRWRQKKNWGGEKRIRKRKGSKLISEREKGKDRPFQPDTKKGANEKLAKKKEIFETGEKRSSEQKEGGGEKRKGPGPKGKHRKE